jgi:hypothetical protein
MAGGGPSDLDGFECPLCYKQYEIRKRPSDPFQALEQYNYEFVGL